MIGNLRKYIDKLKAWKYPGCHETCTLCNRSVSFEDWRYGSHREFCALEFYSLLVSFPVISGKMCGNCQGPLRLLPKDHGRKLFYCDEVACQRLGQIVNDGTNRLLCFVCDYSVCQPLRI